MFRLISEIKLLTMRKVFDLSKELVFVLVVWYLMFCGWQLTQPVMKSEISQIVIIDSDNKFTDVTNNPKRTVHPGDTIEVFYKVHRFVDGIANVERYIETPSKERIGIDLVTRTLQRGESPIIVAYKVPNFIPDGCGYSVYSRNNVNPDFNVLSTIISLIYDSPKVEFCVKQ